MKDTNLLKTSNVSIAVLLINSNGYCGKNTCAGGAGNLIKCPSCDGESEVEIKV